MLHALIEPRIICFKPARDRVIIDHVRSAAAATQHQRAMDPCPVRRTFHQKCRPIGGSQNRHSRWVSPRILQSGAHQTLVPARQTENPISSPSAAATVCCSSENPLIGPAINPQNNVTGLQTRLNRSRARLNLRHQSWEWHGTKHSADGPHRATLCSARVPQAPDRSSQILRNCAPLAPQRPRFHLRLWRPISPGTGVNWAIFKLPSYWPCHMNKTTVEHNR